jgi:hypothetical protein
MEQIIRPELMEMVETLLWGLIRENQGCPVGGISKDERDPVINAWEISFRCNDMEDIRVIGMANETL